MIIVAEASSLITLALCDCVKVLPALFDRVEEVIISNTLHTTKLETFLQEQAHCIGLDKFIIGSNILNQGELSAITLYKYLQADFLLIDEKAGRHVAKMNHIQVVGSLGILVEAKKKGIIPKLKPHIETLRQSQIHFSDNLLNHALYLVNE